MSLFTKRKGRRISTFDDDEEPQNGGGAATGEDQSSEPVVQPIRFGKRPLKQSALRRSINIADSEGGLGGAVDPDENESSAPTTADEATTIPTATETNDGDDGPVVVRPALGRSGSRKNRKRLSTASTSSRLSFGGVGVGGGDDDDDDDGGPVVVTPNKRAGTGGGAGTPSLTQRVLETNAFRKSLSGRLPTRHRANDSDDEDKPSRPTEHDDDEDRPRYSQAYLDELQSSTPNTPQNLASQRKKNGGTLDDDDVMDLDPSELDGAMVVDASELGLSSGSSSSALAGLAPPPPAATVLTATEIQERKDRRARRALEGDADDEDEAEANGEYISLLTDEQKRKKKEKEMTRLVREDEDLGEGFDEFVEEKEALSIGRKAERAARKKRKEEMAALINAAEAGGDAADGEVANDSADDSEAERRAAYDAAQTRAGMDGLQKTRMGGEDDGLEHGVQGTVPIPRMRPLPDLATCLQQMQSAVAALEVDAAQHRRRLAEVEQEKAEIAARETEVQAILDAAAAKYQTVLGTGSAGAGAGAAGAASTPGAGAGTAADNTQSPLRAMPNLGQSPLRSLPPGLAGDYPVQRGLESLGATPTRRPNADDFF